MPELVFFELPVYRIDPDKYTNDKNAYLKRELCPSDDSDNNNMKRAYYERNPTDKANMERHLDKAYGGSWRFNEIVGYIRLYFFGSQVRGYLYMTDVKKIVRTRKKLFIYISSKVVSEEELPYPRSNENVFQTILTYLNRAKRELKGRHVDSELFEKIGPHVDWLGLIAKHRTY